jgi:hypothetical protein
MYQLIKRVAINEACFLLIMIIAAYKHAARITARNHKPKRTYSNKKRIKHTSILLLAMRQAYFLVRFQGHFIPQSRIYKEIPDEIRKLFYKYFEIYSPPLINSNSFHSFCVAEMVSLSVALVVCGTTIILAQNTTNNNYRNLPLLLQK